MTRTVFPGADLGPTLREAASTTQFINAAGQIYRQLEGTHLGHRNDYYPQLLRGLLARICAGPVELSASSTTGLTRSSPEPHPVRKVKTWVSGREQSHGFWHSDHVGVVGGYSLK